MSHFDKCLADDTRTRNLRVLFFGWEEGLLVWNFAGESNLNLQDTAVDCGPISFVRSGWIVFNNGAPKTSQSGVTEQLHADRVRSSG